MPRQGRLAGAGIAEQPKNLRHIAAARLGLEPARNGLERLVLLRRKRGHRQCSRIVSFS
jgi:hypothetical protein